MTEFKKGDRVRVMHEGEITHVVNSAFEVTVDAGLGRYVYANREQLTLLERAKPTLKPGDVVTVGHLTYLVGHTKTSVASTIGEVVSGPSPSELAARIADRPGKYKINGEVFA